MAATLNIVDFSWIVGFAAGVQFTSEETAFAPYSSCYPQHLSFEMIM